MPYISTKKRILTIILKSIVIISAIIGVISSAIAGAESFMGGSSTVFMYFTIQSNILVALVLLVGLILILLNKNINYVCYVIKYVATVSITITGTVFCFVLAPISGSVTWTLANILTHVVVPIVSIIDFFIICVDCKFRRRDIFYTFIPPVLYLIYATIGYIADWKFTKNANYPYFFLNWGSEAGALGFSSELPFIGVLWWILLLLILIFGVGYLYIFIIKKLRIKYNLD